MGSEIIVTGGAGFIGSNLVAALNVRGHEDILVVDSLGKSDKWRNLVGLSFTEYVDKDRFRETVASGAQPPPKVLFHLGACSTTTEKDADYLADNNYRYTIELCRWALQHGTRFIYASSAATYGDGSLGYSDDPSLLPRLKPLNMYAMSKHMFDLWALRHGLLDRIVGLKYFNVYGPGEYHKSDMRSVVIKAYEQIRDGGTVRLFKSYREDYADGEQLRDFLYVKDAVDVTIFFMDHTDKNGIFNVGSGRARTWNDLALAVFSAMQRKPSIEYIDMPPGLSAKYQYRTEADISRLRKAGYSREFISLEDGINDYITNYLSRT